MNVLTARIPGDDSLTRGPKRSEGPLLCHYLHSLTLSGVTELLAFLGVSAIVIATPGPDTALTIRNTLMGGRRAGIFTALGVSSGQAMWTLATAAGIAALLAASEPAFLALKIVGSAYLVWLGLQAILAAIRGQARRLAVQAPRRSSYRQGLLSNLGNPKMAAFFPSLLPQFARLVLRCCWPWG